ncbi:MAG: c-type cytochrome [Woeseiaceae bacterium]|nr:c-type cytochrome [Woeseiaceae bacterium]
MRSAASLIVLLALAACGGPDETPPAPSAEPVDQGPSLEGDELDGIVSGQLAYEHYCVGCHETGILDAPVVGHIEVAAEDWEKVSELWQAVVMEHARDGYFDMPAKGDQPELPDATVDAAVEHMLKITYPDWPADRK